MNTTAAVILLYFNQNFLTPARTSLAVFGHSGTESDVGEHATLCALRLPISTNLETILQRYVFYTIWQKFVDT